MFPGYKWLSPEQKFVYLLGSDNKKINDAVAHLFIPLSYIIDSLTNSLPGSSLSIKYISIIFEERNHRKKNALKKLGTPRIKFACADKTWNSEKNV